MHYPIQSMRPSIACKQLLSYEHSNELEMANTNTQRQKVGNLGGGHPPIRIIRYPFIKH